ncbi:MAG: hypothetical protein GX447_01910 [Elusimicrobia bacterium]|nr:hypothetical protein [Elusimicrobiota bacterium]
MKKETLILWLTSFLTPLALIFYFSPNNNHYLAWAAFIPVWFSVIRASSDFYAFLLSFSSFYAAYFFSLDWMRSLFGWQAWIFYAIFAFWPALHSLALKKFFEKAQKTFFIWLSVIGLSALYAGLEYFRSEIWFLNCPWLGLGYAQHSNPAIYQSLSFWGVFGLTFFIIFFNLSLFSVLAKRIFSPFLTAAVILIILNFWGEKRLLSDIKGEPIKALLIQDESYSFDKLLSMSKNRKDEDIIIWPENSFYINEKEEYIRKAEEFRKAFPKKSFYALLPMGIKKEINGKIKRENFAALLNTANGEIQIYEKMHPVPFVEKGLKKGPYPYPLNYKDKKIGVQICYDLNFQNGSSALAWQKAGIILAPTNDPIEWSEKQQRQHADMSSARAVENGVWILRPATSGISQVIDPLGRVKAEIKSAESSVLSAQAEIVKTPDTFYSKYGRFIPFLLLVFSCIVLIFAFLPFAKKDIV